MAGVTKYVHLIGTEQVQSAAAAMGRAAEEMKRAASQIEYTLQQNARSQDELLSRLENALRDDRLKRGLPE